MKKFTYSVKDAGGLHARPAGLLVKCAQSCSSTVQISKGGKSADAKKLFAVMSLGAKQNDEVTIEIEGANEAVDCTTLQNFCAKNL